MIKVALRAVSITDCLTLFRLLERARRAGREMIAVAMGEAGLATRVLAPARGAFLTFAALDGEHATAPGQLDADTLRRLYRFDSIDDETAICALVGSPVAHSLSPHIHNAAFNSTATNAVYLPLEVVAVDDFMRRMAHPHTRELDWPLVGLSVTAPHKRAVIDYLDWMDRAAVEIGAVNTIVCTKDGLLGYNTDAGGFIAPLENLTGLRGAPVAVIGAGGAARAALWALRARGARLTLFARDATRAVETAAEFGARVEPFDDARFGDFQIVVNATPLGTRGAQQEKTPARAGQLRGARIAYDLVYNPSETLFLREAREAGCQVIGGLSMLVSQAAAQFKLWTGREAPFDVMRRAAEAAMKG